MENRDYNSGKKLKILTTNSSSADRFGGIHTTKMEHIRYSPQHTFYVTEFNHEKKYVSHDNLNLNKVDVRTITNGKSMYELLEEAENISSFDKSVEGLVNEFQNSIRGFNPDVIMIPGTSLTSYFLFKAARREGVLNKTVQEYAGVLEKEIGNYSGDSRYILGEIGKVFVSDEARDNISYIFPSKVCKSAVEEIHNVKLENSHIVWNGISEAFFNNGFNRKVPSELTLGYVGRVHHVKNLPFFFGLRENLDEPVRLNILTDVSSCASKPIGKLLLNRMSEGEVFYYAPRSRDELKSFYESKLSAGVVSSFFETYCNGAIESLVSGTPTILSDRAGAKEVYEKYGLEKLLFSIEDMSSFKDALGFAKDIGFTIEPKLTKEIYNDLSWEKVISRYNQVLNVVSPQ